MFSSVFLWCVRSPRGPSAVFPALTLVPSVLSCLPVLLTQDASRSLPCDHPDHSRPHSLSSSCHYPCGDTWSLVNVLLFSVPFVYLLFVQIGQFSQPCPCVLFILCPSRALGPMLDTKQILRTYFLRSYCYGRMEMTDSS